MPHGSWLNAHGQWKIRTQTGLMDVIPEAGAEMGIGLLWDGGFLSLKINKIKVSKFQRFPITQIPISNFQSFKDSKNPFNVF